MSFLLPHRLTLPTLVLLSAGALFLPTLQGQEKGDHPEKREAHEDEDTKLGHLMEKLRADLKGAGKAIEAKDKVAAWKAVCAAQQVLLEAKQESPASAQSKPEATRPGYVDTFRSAISMALKETCEVEIDVLNEKFDDAAKGLHEIMGPMQKAGHRQFRND